MLFHRYLPSFLTFCRPTYEKHPSSDPCGLTCMHFKNKLHFLHHLTLSLPYSHFQYFRTLLHYHPQQLQLKKCFMYTDNDFQQPRVTHISKFPELSKPEVLEALEACFAAVYQYFAKVNFFKMCDCVMFIQRQ